MGRGSHYWGSLEKSLTVDPCVFFFSATAHRLDFNSSHLPDSAVARGAQHPATTSLSGRNGREMVASNGPAYIYHKHVSTR